MKNRILSIALALALIFGAMPVTAFAANGCNHVHDELCGYADAAPCGYVHTHDESCGYNAATDSGCTDTHIHNGQCGYIVAAPCNHVHDGNCGGLPSANSGNTITFGIPQDEFGETAFFLPENEPLTEADLLAGVTATDENGTPVTVTVKDADGLDLANPQMRGAYPNPPYVITYAAEHPVSGDVFTETRDLYVTLGAGGIMPTATDTWDSNGMPDISSWLGSGNVITVRSGATGTLTIPNGLTELTINGGTGAPVEINGSINIPNTVTNAVTLNLNNVTINADNTDGAVYRNGAVQLTLNVTGTVTLNGQAGGGSALNAARLTIGGSGTLYATGGNNPGGQGGNGIIASIALTIETGCTVHATGGRGGDSATGTGGSGGDGVSMGGGNITNNAGGTITAKGGDGGNSTSGNGGNGGRGVQAGSGITNGGTITVTGGRGGNSTSGNGGNGGDGGDGGITNNAGGKITATGGDGGNSTGTGNGGVGGFGVYGGGGSIINNGSIIAGGGRGGSSSGGNGGDGGNGGAAGSITNNAGGTIISTGGRGGDSSTATGGDGGRGVYSQNSITNNAGGTITGAGGGGGDSAAATGGNGGGGVDALTGNLTNDGTLTGSGGSGGDSNGTGRGGGGGSGVNAGINLTNNAGGTITGTGGTGGDSTSGRGGNGGAGASANTAIENNAGSASAFKAMGGPGGIGSTPGAIDGQAATGTVTGTILEIPTVTFAAQGGVDLQNPTYIVFQESPAGSLSTYNFVSVRFENAAGSGYTFYPGVVTGLAYDSTSGELTIPQAAFGLPGVLSLSSGSYNAIITFEDNQSPPTYTFDYTCGLTLTGVTVPPTPTPPTVPQSSGRSGNIGTQQAPAPRPITKQEALDAFNKALSSLTSGQTTVNVRFVNCASIPLDVLKALADAAKKAGVTVIIHADTVSDSAVQTRLYIDPAKSSKGITLAAADSPDAVNAAIRFKSQFANKLTAVSTGQQGSFGQPVKIAVKVDLSGMDTENLVFYSYDSKTNTYKRIEKPAYWIDKNGYLHFTTELAGDIIISDGPLEKKS